VVQLTWQDRSVNETGFRIERREANGAFSEIATVGANVTQYQDTNAQPGTAYEYRIAAQNGQGSSPWTPVAAVSTPP
jgi:uncharacterized protein